MISTTVSVSPHQIVVNVPKTHVARALTEAIKVIPGVRLRQKIPSEAFGADSVLDLDKAQTVKRLIEEAKHMLIGRLLTVGGAR